MGPCRAKAGWKKQGSFYGTRAEGVVSLFPTGPSWAHPGWSVWSRDLRPHAYRASGNQIKSRPLEPYLHEVGGGDDRRLPTGARSAAQMTEIFFSSPTQRSRPSRTGDFAVKTLLPSCCKRPVPCRTSLSDSGQEQMLRMSFRGTYHNFQVGAAREKAPRLANSYIPLRRGK